MVSKWLDEIERALSSFGSGLGIEIQFSEASDVPPDRGGAVIPVAGSDHTYLVGLMASPEDKRLLTCALLQMDPDTESASEADQDDAIGEMVNVAAGRVKNRIGSIEAAVELGLPMWLDGPPSLRRALDYDIRDVQFGPARLTAILLQLPLSVETQSRRNEAEQRRRVEQELQLAQKLEAVGQLAAGIAHEINTPTQYVADNLDFLADGFEELTGLLKSYRSLHTAAQEGEVAAALLTEVREAEEQADLEFLEEEIPRALTQSQEGVGRIARIVLGMKKFSHPGSNDMCPVNLNEAIEATVTVSTNEWKYVADLETKLDPDLPKVPCVIGELNQVVLNLIVNAAHALEKTGNQEKGTIRIRTYCEGQKWAVVEVADTGTGIPEDVCARIFDPFYTTKEVGKGTGQGLAIARSVVVDKHGGTIDVETEEGKGSTFIVRLPLERDAQGSSEAGSE